MIKSSGHKSFNRCSIKTTTFEFKEETKDYYEGYLAKLTCPRLEMTGNEPLATESPRDTKIYAMKSLGKIAGAIVCNTCPYSNMTPAEVSIDQAEFAEAEVRRIKAYQELASARKEIGQINQRILGQ